MQRHASISRLALACALVSILPRPAAAKPPTNGPATGPTPRTDPADPPPIVGAITLEVSLDLGDLGPDWRESLGFTDHTTRFQLRWQVTGAPPAGAVFRVLDADGVLLKEGPVATHGAKSGVFELRLQDLPERDGYLVRVQATNGTHPVGSPSNAITLTQGEQQPIPFFFGQLQIEGYREQFGVPGLSVAVSCHPGDVKEWVAGVRRHGNSVKAKAGDRWHIGSNTKAFTTTMIAKLVEEGLIDWDTSIWELTHGPRNLFPELKGAAPLSPSTLHPRFEDVTIEHLASHRSGMKMTSGEDAPTRQFANYAKDPQEFRWDTVRRLLTRNHTGIIGEWRYGHGNYMLLGVVIERLRGKPYEQVIEEEILQPAGMSTAAFGMPTDVVLPPPGPGIGLGLASTPDTDNPWVRQTYAAYSVDTTAQPNGHVLGGGSPKVDNLALPPVWNPAGGLYLSNADMLRFLRLHVDGTVGTLSLPAASRQKLHSVYMRPDRRAGPADAKAEDRSDPNYGFGFGQWTDGSDGRVLGHDGTYGRFYSSFRVYLDRGFVVTASANLAGGAASGDDAVAAARNWAVAQAKLHCTPKKKLKVKVPKVKPKAGGAKRHGAAAPASPEMTTDFDLRTRAISDAVTRPVKPRAQGPAGRARTRQER